ncbi:uncharacterized protein LOC123261732 [Cotesia glomerata]|uniref:uncharacterized protein LOC123261732 n=1 Tax=Cotesia glomerata TaxID=32391 RepID=UPI001D00FCC0|nr:uncharacterized protein LOC123261732 [Cotesia glomerata]
MVKNVIIQDSIEIASSRRQCQSDNVGGHNQISNNPESNIVPEQTETSISHPRSESTIPLQAATIDNNNMEEERSNIIIIDDNSETEEPGPRIDSTIDDEIIIISDDETDINNDNEQISSVAENPNPDISLSMDEFPVSIREKLNTMVFDDVKVTMDSKFCGCCLLYQPRTIFRPCRHRSLCLRCKKGYELLSAQENNELKCLICNRPSTSIMILY